MDWERLPVAPLYMLTSELTVHMLKNPSKGADHSTLEGGRGGGWFCKNISCKRLSEGKNCMQHKRNRKLMGKKGKKDILPTILLEKKILDDQKSPKPKPTHRGNKTTTLTLPTDKKAAICSWQHVKEILPLSQWIFRKSITWYSVSTGRRFKEQKAIRRRRKTQAILKPVSSWQEGRVGTVFEQYR